MASSSTRDAACSKEPADVAKALGGDLQRGAQAVVAPMDVARYYRRPTGARNSPVSILAALHHPYFACDNTLRRMLPEQV